MPIYIVARKLNISQALCREGALTPDKENPYFFLIWSTALVLSSCCSSLMLLFFSFLTFFCFNDPEKERVQHVSNSLSKIFLISWSHLGLTRANLPWQKAQMGIYHFSLTFKSLKCAWQFLLIQVSQHTPFFGFFYSTIIQVNIIFKIK